MNYTNYTPTPGLLWLDIWSHPFSSDERIPVKVAVPWSAYAYLVELQALVNERMAYASFADNGVRGPRLLCRMEDMDREYMAMDVAHYPGAWEPSAIWVDEDGVPYVPYDGCSNWENAPVVTHICPDGTCQLYWPGIDKSAEDPLIESETFDIQWLR